jgi:imidazolonepropionase-like amidohydrolase
MLKEQERMKAMIPFLLAVLVGGSAQAQTVAVKGERVYTVSGRMISNGVVLVKDGKIERVGTASQVRIPDGYAVTEAKVVTPGFIDARNTVGISGYLNVPADQDQLERSSPFQPELRAIDAYNARERLVEYVRGLGITTIHTGHGPGALASGQTMIVKTAGGTLNEALIDSVTMVAFTLGPSVSGNYSSPGTRSKQVAMLRAEFLKAQDYMAKENPVRDLKMDIIARVLRREVRALFTVQQATEIQSALRLREEFGFDLVLDGAAEAYLMLPDIKASGVPVLVHPPMMRTYGEGRNATLTLASELHKAGIPFAFQAGFEGYVPKTRIVHFEAAIALQSGLPFDAALNAITLGSARILGIDARVGSLEPGKDADLALFDGDPFEYTTRTVGVMINGAWVSTEAR